MTGIEEILAFVTSLQAADGELRNALEFFPGRAYLALSPDREPELFFRGSRASFHQVDHDRSLSWGEYELKGSGEPLPALVLRTPEGAEGRRLMAHVAYEALRLLEDRPKIENPDLVENLRPFFRLVLTKSILSPTDQIGLVGELQLLNELLGEAREASHRGAALAGWVGPESARRDFSFPGGVVVEVKAGASGIHRVGMDQLIPTSGDQEIYLGTVKVHRDPSAALKLPEMVERVEGALGSEALIQRFWRKLGSYGDRGYNPGLCDEYEVEPGFFVEPTELRRVTNSKAILRKQSFREGEPPPSVSRINYALDTSGIPRLSPEEKKFVFRSVVEAPIQGSREDGTR